MIATNLVKEIWCSPGIDKFTLGVDAGAVLVWGESGVNGISTHKGLRNFCIGADRVFSHASMKRGNHSRHPFDRTSAFLNRWQKTRRSGHLGVARLGVFLTRTCGALGQFLFLQGRWLPPSRHDEEQNRNDQERYDDDRCSFHPDRYKAGHREPFRPINRTTAPSLGEGCVIHKSQIGSRKSI